MKSKIPHFGAVALLTLGLFFGFQSASKAFTDERKHHVELTVCCSGTAISAYSNNCIGGSDECDEGSCPSGTTEKVGFSCSSPE